jgi:CheY-like chemotaxis protein
MDDYLAKPFDKGQLAAILARWAPMRAAPSVSPARPAA